MNPHVSRYLFWNLCLLVISFVVGNKLDGAAQLCGTVPMRGDEQISGTILPIVEIRGEVPYVEYRGKKVAVSKDSMQLYKSEIMPPDDKSAPHWILATNLKSQNRETRFVNTPGGPFNKELFFSVDLESPVALDKVWIVMSLTTERGGSGNIVQEIGSLSPYSPKTVTIHRELTVELGEASFYWHVFSHEREILHSLMDNRVFEKELKWKASVARSGVRNAVAEPYLTFPPRDLSKAKGNFVLEVKITTSGELNHAVVMGANDKKTEKRLLEAVRHWWFLPKIENGQPVAETRRVTVDLSHPDKWSNEFVKLEPIAAK